MDLNVKIYCVTPEICALIQKVLRRYKLNYSCMNVSELLNIKSQEDIITDCKSAADIIILDQELEKEFKLKLIQSYQDKTFICLPSLDENEITVIPENVIRISEPFKLSEFESVLLKIINKKNESDVEK